MEKVIKPWGWYQVLAKGKGWKLKLLSLNPYSQTSLQSHKLRDEIWFTVDNVCSKKIKEFHIARIIKKNEKHQASNYTKDQMNIFEVQIGKCIESDVKRYEDLYGRTKVANDNRNRKQKA